MGTSHHAVTGLTEEQEDKILRLHILENIPQSTLAGRFSKHPTRIRTAIRDAAKRLLLREQAIKNGGVLLDITVKT